LMFCLLTLLFIRLMGYMTPVIFRSSQGQKELMTVSKKRSYPVPKNDGEQLHKTNLQSAEHLIHKAGPVRENDGEQLHQTNLQSAEHPMRYSQNNTKGLVSSPRMAELEAQRTFNDRENPEPSCDRKLFHQRTPADYDAILRNESQHYRNSAKFANKMRESDAQWNDRSIKHTGRFGAIHGYLKSLISNIKNSKPNVLELGFGAGTNMIVVHEFLQQRGDVWGVELTSGWVDHAKAKYIHSGLHFIQGDITKAVDVVPNEIHFDIIFLADVWEHIPSYRLGPLWHTIVSLLQPHGKLYIHIPNEAKQKAEQARSGHGQFFEEIVRVKDIQQQAECFGMKIEERGTDNDKIETYESIVLSFAEK